jgi:hypothetical protein
MKTMSETYLLALPAKIDRFFAATQAAWGYQGWLPLMALIIRYLAYHGSYGILS